MELTRLSCGEGGMVHKIWLAFLTACTTLSLAAPTICLRNTSEASCSTQICSNILGLLVNLRTCNAHGV